MSPSAIKNLPQIFSPLICYLYLWVWIISSWGLKLKLFTSFRIFDASLLWWRQGSSISFIFASAHWWPWAINVNNHQLVPFPFGRRKFFFLNKNLMIVVVTMKHLYSIIINIFYLHIENNSDCFSQQTFPAILLTNQKQFMIVSKFVVDSCIQFSE